MPASSVIALVQTEYLALRGLKQPNTSIGKIRRKSTSLLQSEACAACTTLRGLLARNRRRARAPVQQWTGMGQPEVALVKARARA